jgi:hypothetical protein
MKKDPSLFIINIEELLPTSCSIDDNNQNHPKENNQFQEGTL